MLTSLHCRGDREAARLLASPGQARGGARLVATIKLMAQAGEPSSWLLTRAHPSARRSSSVVGAARPPSAGSSQQHTQKNKNC